ncbi:MAG: TRAP transporter large permease subunit, partial [Synergistaceae bacterium]
RLEALKCGLQGLPAEELPKKKDVLKKAYLFVPIIGLVFTLLKGYSPMYAAVIGIVLSWLVSLPSKENRMGPKKIISAIHDGVENITLVCVACASAGIALSSVSLTGIGQKLVSLVLAFAGNTPLFALFLVMIVSLVLGMGLPTTGAYILASALGVPILAKLGYPLISAHMFVFYFAIISNITPPVALAAYAASSIAGSEPNQTGFTACRLGFLAFVVPFAFCYDPGILLQLDLMGNLMGIIACLVACFGFAFAIIGYINRNLAIWERAVFVLFSLMALTPDNTLTLTGSAGVIGSSIIFGKLFKKDKGAPKCDSIE